jgi:hypothetical protein
LFDGSVQSTGAMSIHEGPHSGEQLSLFRALRAAGCWRSYPLADNAINARAGAAKSAENPNFGGFAVGSAGRPGDERKPATHISLGSSFENQIEDRKENVMRTTLSRIAVVPATAVVALAGTAAFSPGANASAEPTSGAAAYTDPADFPAYPGDPNSAYAQGYSAGARDADRAGEGSYDNAYAQGFRDAQARNYDRPAASDYSHQTYAPAYAQSGPNSAAAPRTSEAQTSQNEACGTNPGENNHTLGLPKLVNVNMC